MAKLNPSTNPPSSSKRFLRNRSAISRPPTPSAAVLAVLASLVASADSFPVVCYDSSDPPPSFLCPSLEPQDKFGVQDFVLPPQTPPPSSPVPGPSTITRTDVPAPPVARRVRRNIPAGYTQGDDGRWRKLSTWSLYGSTVCVCHDGSGETGNVPMDDLATTSAPSATSETDSLPPGWSRATESSAIRTTLILSLSLVLAAIIAVFIIAFLMWRRKRKDRLQKDVEKKLGKWSEPRRSVDSERGGRAKSKLWVRATARWRENARQSARRRRNARLSTASLHAPNNSVTSLHRTMASTPSSPGSVSSSLPPSRASSPTPTVSTIHSIPSSQTRSDHEPQTINIEPPSPSPPPAPPLPPAYHGGPLLLSDISPAKYPAQLSPGGSPHLTHIDSPLSDSPPPSPLESDITPLNLHIAHVATDDKAVLRQMEVLSSQPPTEPGSSCDAHGSAPVLYEDDLQSLEYEDAPELDPPPVGFPLPPTVLPSSKGKAAALECYDYDDLSVEPDLQPSAPPFEAENPTVPSAPSQDEAQLLPSAPPEILAPGDDPTAPTDDSLSLQTRGPSIDAPRLVSSKPPQYRP